MVFSVNCYLKVHNEMKWNLLWIEEAEKANGTKSASLWFQTNLFARVAEGGSLQEAEANINLMVQLKERLQAS